jgi:hypothetical protein
MRKAMKLAENTKLDDAVYKRFLQKTVNRWTYLWSFALRKSVII